MKIVLIRGMTSLERDKHAINVIPLIRTIFIVEVIS
jgi:biopolymer transport protein ExbD